jgi:hypothetical protein
MALSTLEKQRIIAALNNIQLSNKVIALLDHTDKYVSPFSSAASLAPEADAATFEISVVQNSAISEDLSANVFGRFTMFESFTDVFATFVNADDAGLLTGTAPAFVGDETDVHTFACSAASPYGYCDFFVQITVTAA